MYAGSFPGAEWLNNLVIDRVGKVAIIANSIGFRPVPEGFYISIMESSLCWEWRSIFPCLR